MRKITLITLCLALLCLIAWYLDKEEGQQTVAMEKETAPSTSKAIPEVPPPPLTEDEEGESNIAVVSQSDQSGIIVEVAPNDTLAEILARHQVGAGERFALSRAVSAFQDLKQLRPGRRMEISLSDETDAKGKRCVTMFRLMLERDQLVEFSHSDHANFASVRKSFQHEKKIRTVSGTIDSSFFLAARRQGVPRSVFTEFYNLLGARVDFQREIQKGDTFQVVYEENDDSPYGGVHAGTLLYASMTLLGKSVGYFIYTTLDGFTGYFDENGHSVDSRLLKTPLSAGVLSSLFGSRKHPVYGYKRMHRGIDFSARKGTPILAAGDGVVDRIGTYGGYGNFIRLRHGSEFMTGYAHLSAYADGLRAGTRVAQGDIIGYVGSTGLTTGPNLHYEVFRYGKRVNPMTLELPPVRALQGDELRRFREFLNTYQFPIEGQSV